MDAYEIVVGATAHEFSRTIYASDGITPKDLTGCTLELQAQSHDLPEISIVESGVSLSPTTGIVVFTGCGAWLALAQLEGKPYASFVARVKWASSEGTDYSDQFTLKFVRPDLGTEFPEEDAVFNDLNKLVRHYAFEVEPPQVMKTFPAGDFKNIERPSFYWHSAGSAVESNKIYEMALEREINDVLFEGPDSSDAMDYPLLVDGQWWGSAQTPANIAGGFIAVEIYTMNRIPPFDAAPSAPCVMLRQSLKDKTYWELCVAKGDGVTPSTIMPFTIPLKEGTSAGEGHRVALYYNFQTKTIKAWVDGVVRATFNDAATFPDPANLVAQTTRIGLLVYTTGTNTGTSVIYGAWSAWRCTSYGTQASAFAP